MRGMVWAPRHLDEIIAAVGEHLVLSGTATLVGLILALMAGLGTVRRPRLYKLILTVAGLFYVIPSLAMFAILIPLVGLGFAPAVISLSAYSFLIILRNIDTGFRSTPREIFDAAEGQGYSNEQRLLRVQLPLALPMIMAGIRLALVTSIGIATIAAFIGGGGLGAIILIGVNQEHIEKILVGSLTTAALALTCDMTLTLAERVLLPWR